jgi:hypothetical protein
VFAPLVPKSSFTSAASETIRFQLIFFGPLRRRTGGRFSSLVTGQMPPTGHRKAVQGSLHRLDIGEATTIGKRSRNGRTAEAQSPSETRLGLRSRLAQVARESDLCFLLPPHRRRTQREPGSHACRAKASRGLSGRGLSGRSSDRSPWCASELRQSRRREIAPVAPKRRRPRAKHGVVRCISSSSWMPSSPVTRRLFLAVTR